MHTAQPLESAASAHMQYKSGKSWPNRKLTVESYDSLRLPGYRKWEKKGNTAITTTSIYLYTPFTSTHREWQEMEVPQCALAVWELISGLHRNAKSNIHFAHDEFVLVYRFLSQPFRFRIQFLCEMWTQPLSGCSILTMPAGTDATTIFTIGTATIV